MLGAEPAETRDAILDALLGATATYLAAPYIRDNPPRRASHRKRILAEPHFTTSSDAPAMKEWLPRGSPAEFKRRNIFTQARPPRRNMSERLAWAEGEVGPRDEASHLG